MADAVELGIIGGSGLYNMSELTNVEQQHIDTPFGEPSGDVIVGTLSGKRVAFIPRHGVGHVKNPSEVNYRANIFALKSLGVRFLIGVSACGSLREEFAPGDIVIPHQIFDFTKGIRKMSFFEDGLVAHIGTADPFCPHLSQILYNAASFNGKNVHMGGKYITIEGPRFSTKGESNIYRSWGLDIIGMTASPEFTLAREAEMSYATMAHVTDYDVWHEEPVTTEMVIKTFKANVEHAHKAVIRAVEMIDTDAEYEAHSALAGSILSSKDSISESAKKRLHLLVGKYLE